MSRILLAITALLIYGSLYPWEFHAARVPGGPVHALLHSWQFSLDRFTLRDVALNIAIYVPFGAAAYLWLRSRTWPVVLAAMLSVAVELTQFYDARRFTSMIDVITNVIGAAVGMLCAIPASLRRSRYELRVVAPGPLLLLACWALAMLFPAIPDLSRTHLAGKMHDFFSGGFSFVAAFALLVQWMAAARMLRSVSAVVFPVLGVVLPARFLTLGLTSDWIYWATFGAAWLIWFALFTGSRRRDVALAAAIVASVFLIGLAPFHFSAHPQAFNWIPMRALFMADRGTAFALFLRKAFLYGSAIWLLEQSGLRLRTGAALVAAGLGAIEAAQVYLPNHAPEITDPLLALFMAWTLHRLSRAVPHSRQAGTLQYLSVSNQSGTRA